MAEKRTLSPEILLHISQILQLPMRGLTAVIELLDDGGTVPFIARYRKEATGNLDEVQIRAIEEKLGYFRDLADRLQGADLVVGRHDAHQDRLVGQGGGHLLGRNLAVLIDRQERHAEAFALEAAAEQKPNLGIVLDDQDGRR